MHDLRMGLGEAGRIQLVGALTFSTVGSALTEVRAALGKSEALVIDLQGVDHADSSALAMLLQLVDDAEQKQVSLSFDHMPSFLLGIARLSNAEGLLPLVP